jgi:hypothetical protein
MPIKKLAHQQVVIPLHDQNQKERMRKPTKHLQVPIIKNSPTKKNKKKS